MGNIEKALITSSKSKVGGKSTLQSLIVFTYKIWCVVGIHISIQDGVIRSHIVEIEMESDDKKVKEQLIDTIKNIKKKFQSLKEDENNLNDSLNVQFKPLLSPLNKLVEHASYAKRDGVSDSMKEHRHVGNMASGAQPIVPLQRMKYISLHDFLNVLGAKDHDSKYGVKQTTQGRYQINQVEVKFNNNEISICGKSFTLTIGLMNLLFLNQPLYYSNADLSNYREILLLSKVHLNKHGKLKSDNKNYKYNNIVKSLFEDFDGQKIGKSLQTNYVQLLSDKRIDYKYWDDANELVDRLRLLIASQAAGHSGHNNEIIAIIEELREANVIE